MSARNIASCNLFVSKGEMLHPAFSVPMKAKE